MRRRTAVVHPPGSRLSPQTRWGVSVAALLLFVPFARTAEVPAANETARSAAVIAGGVVNDPLLAAAYFSAARGFQLLPEAEVPLAERVPRVVLTGVKDGRKIFTGTDEEKSYC